MLTLALDTATKYTKIALFQGDSLLIETSFVNSQDESRRVLPEIDGLFRKTKLDPQNLEALVVGIGPGSFTGTRVGLSIANVLISSLKIPVLTLDSLEIIKMCLPVERRGATIALLNAGRGEYYAEIEHEVKFLTADELSSLLEQKKYKYWVGYLSEEQEKNLVSLDKVGEEEWLSFGQALIASGSLTKKNFERRVLIEPMYVREVSVTLKNSVICNI